MSTQRLMGYEDLKLEKLKQQKHEVDGKNSSLLTC